MSSSALGASLAASVLWGTSDFAGGTLSRRLRPLHVLAGSQIASTVLLGAAVVATGSGHWSGPWLPWSLGAGLAWALGMGALYSALAIGRMGVVAPIASVGAVVPVAVGLASGERPGPLALGGVALALAGVVGASGPDASGAGDRSSQGPSIVLAVAAAVLFGVEITLLAHASRSSVPMALVGMRVGALAALVLALAPLRRRRRHRQPVRPAGLRDVPLLLGLGLLDLGATAAYAAATRVGELDLVAVLASLYPAVTVLLARQVHGERLSRLQQAGVGAVLAGAACIGLAAA